MASKDDNHNRHNNLEVGSGGGGGKEESEKFTTKASVQETLQFVSKSLLPSIELFGSNEQLYSPDDGLDFLQVKNSLLLSYLIDLTVYCREQHRANTVMTTTTTTTTTDGTTQKSSTTNKHGSNMILLSRRLNEMKVVLDKMRGLDKKLRYQIDKLLAAGSNATSFAMAGGAGQDDDNDNQNGMPFSLPEDPLQFRPNPRSLEQKEKNNKNNNSEDSNDDDDDDDHNASDSSSNSDDDDPRHDAEEDDEEEEAEKDDDDLQAAKATLSMARAKKNNGNKHSRHHDSDDDDDNDTKHGLYRAPRMASVPYAHDVERKQAQKEKQSKRRMRTSELALMLKSQYGDAPEQDDIHGGGDFGKQKAAARRMAEKEAETTKYEESTMVRLAVSRQDKKDRKRLMREEHSNLSAISSNLSNLVQDANFGIKGNSNEDDDDDEEDMYPPRFGNKNKQTSKGKGGKRSSGGGGFSSSAFKKNTTKRRRTK
jgi:U3 small nucleolar ribonucleoprotein protein LCP5